MLGCPKCGVAYMESEVHYCPKDKPISSGIGTALLIFGGVVGVGMIATVVMCCVLPMGKARVNQVTQQTQPQTPKPLSDDEKRLGEQPVYCPGQALAKNGLMGSKNPPCAVELYLGRALHDPSSFQITERCTVSAGKSAWVVDCTFRAKNAFGALRRQRWRFLVKGNTVVDANEL